MRKRISRAVTAALCLTIACGTLLSSGCKINEPEVPERGSHYYGVEKTDEYIVKAGKTDYKILLEKDASDLKKFAAEEVQTFVKQSSGAELPIVYDTEAPEDGKYISLGNTSAYKASETYKTAETETAKIGSNGFLIRSEDDDIFVIGEDFGVANGCYELLYRLCGYEFYSADEIKLNGESDVFFYRFDIFDVPDFEYRIVPQGFQRNETVARRYRMHRLEDIWANRSIYCHNTLTYIPEETYGEKHPKWFSRDRKDQLCHTARGDNNERQALIDTVAAKLVAALEAAPDKDTVGFTQMDNKHACECDACLEEFAKYGTDSAAALKFCNDLAAAMRKIFENKGVNRSFKVVFFAYEATVSAPVKENADGTRVPIDENVICDKNVSVFYAPIAVKYTVPFDSDEYDGFNKQYLQTLKDWQILCKDVYLWVYSTNFSHYLVPYNSFDSLQQNYQIFKDLGVKYLQDLGQYNVKQSAAWCNLTAYLQAKLQWNSSLDYETLLQNYFSNYFKNAAEDMRSLFNLQQTRLREIQKEKLADGSCYEESETWRAIPNRF